jgi:uncharacterized protein (TIGR03437 family)
LLSVRQQQWCSSATPPLPLDCLMTFITLQIPYEVKFNPLGYPEYLTHVVISQDGVDSQSFVVGLAYDAIHVITSCDKDPAAIRCKPIVTHTDGTLVSAESPAGVGEVVIIYAWGLGWTIPSVPTGAATPQPAPETYSPGWTGVQVSFDFNVDAAPSRRHDQSPPVVKAFLTPGEIGLYQLNVQLPGSFPNIPPCGPSTDASSIRSNLTIDLSGGFSYDGAPICVQASL